MSQGSAAIDAFLQQEAAVAVVTCLRGGTAA